MFLHPDDHQPHPAIIPGEEIFLHPNDHQPHRPIIRGEGRSNPVGFLKFPSAKLHVSALAVSCRSARVLLTTPSPSPLLGIPCLAPSQGLCTCSYHSSLLNQNPSSSQHSTAQGETHRLLSPYSAAIGTLPAALQSKTASNSAKIFSPQPVSMELCPSHSTVTGLVMAIINIHTS